MSEQKTHKIVIIGAGPAGYTSAIYAARAGNSPLLIEGLAPGGQLMITTDIENFPGFGEPVTGPELMEQMRNQAQRVGTEFISDVVENVDLSSRPFKVKISDAEILAETLIIATGASARWMGIESEQKFMGRGVSACATCDGFFYKDRKVAVIGGGDTACEEAHYLSTLASQVILVHRRDELRASKIMAKRVLDNPKITVAWNSIVDEMLGNDSGITGLRLKDTQSKETRDIEVDGIFVAIGHIPATDFLHGQVKTDEAGFIITKPGTASTSVDGVFAAGDVQDPHYRQAITAAGTGCMAAIEAGRFLDEN